MWAKLSLALLLLLCGCDSRTQINYGAQRAVYVGTVQHMFNKIPAGIPKSVGRLNGYYSLADGSITINEQLSKWETARTFAHELAHAYDKQQFRDMWELLALYEGRDFTFNPHQHPKE